MERSDRTDERRSSGRICGVVLGIAVLVVLAAGAGRLTVPAASPLDACPAGVAGAFTNLSRPLVPVGATVIRGFRIDGSVSEVQLSAPAEYRATQVPGNGAYVLRLTAPHAGPFSVTATWTERYVDGAGATQSCSASATTALTAGPGAPLALRPPPARRFPGVQSVQYDNPMIWTWRCSAGSDPRPLVATVRWEVDPRQLPAFSKGGKAPFKFTRRSKTFTVRAVDACDARLAGAIEKRLRGSTTLRVIAAGSVASGGGELYVKLKGGFRNARGNVAPLHLGITLRQGPRTLLAQKVCSWQQTGFVVARGKGISCWW